jgi:site-specific DNA-methyltransferase (adenine-specific)
MVGLQTTIPNHEDRMDHIFQNMLFGIATSRLTALLSRRTLYCASDATSSLSLAHRIAAFSDAGNVRFQAAQHDFDEKTCTICGAPRSIERQGRENYAYEFIHSSNRTLFTDEKGQPVKFNVIIGNPPYQMQTGGGKDGGQAKPIYNLFVEQALRLEPDYISLIIPARWYSGGMGLDSFRTLMTNPPLGGISDIRDYPNAAEVFPDTPPAGGVMYFLWQKQHKGVCRWERVEKGVSVERFDIDLRTVPEVLLRSTHGYKILEKVRSAEGVLGWHDSLVSAVAPFGWYTKRQLNFKREPFDKSTKVYIKSSAGVARDEGGQPVGYMKGKVEKDLADMLGKWKVLAAKAGSGDKIIAAPFIAAPGEACTETYLVLASFSSKKEAERQLTYIRTKFFRYMVSLCKATQNTSRRSFQFVPIMPADQVWDDAALYTYFGLSAEEVAHIEETVQAM